MKKLLMFSIAMVFAVGLSRFSFASIVGSPHDFSGFQATGGQICVACHTPHNAESNAAPLWNHEMSIATYTVYSSPSMQATVGQPSGSSKLCLSCHDGTVAIDAFGGNPGSFTFPAQSPNNLGTDLSNDHPISFTYDDALAVSDGGLYEPTNTVVTIGSGSQTRTGTISDVMLEGGTELQCQSCHSVHNDFVALDVSSAGKILKISIAQSTLCLTCHNK